MNLEDEFPDDIETLQGQSYVVNGKEAEVLMVLGGPLEVFCLMRWRDTGKLFQESAPEVIHKLLNSQL
jgi:hypothetical protein